MSEVAPGVRVIGIKRRRDQAPLDTLSVVPDAKRPHVDSITSMLQQSSLVDTDASKPKPSSTPRKVLRRVGTFNSRDLSSADLSSRVLAGINSLKSGQSAHDDASTNSVHRLAPSKTEVLNSTSAAVEQQLRVRNARASRVDNRRTKFDPNADDGAGKNGLDSVDTNSSNALDVHILQISAPPKANKQRVTLQPPPPSNEILSPAGVPMSVYQEMLQEVALPNQNTTSNEIRVPRRPIGRKNNAQHAVSQQPETQPVSGAQFIAQHGSLSNSHGSDFQQMLGPQSNMYASLLAEVEEREGNDSNVDVQDGPNQVALMSAIAAGTMTNALQPPRSAAFSSHRVDPFVTRTPLTSPAYSNYTNQTSTSSNGKSLKTIDLNSPLDPQYASNAPIDDDFVFDYYVVDYSKLDERVDQNIEEIELSGADVLCLHDELLDDAIDLDHASDDSNAENDEREDYPDEESGDEGIDDDFGARHHWHRQHADDEYFSDENDAPFARPPPVRNRQDYSDDESDPDDVSRHHGYDRDDAGDSQDSDSGHNRHAAFGDDDPFSRFERPRHADARAYRTTPASIATAAAHYLRDVDSHVQFRSLRSEAATAPNSRAEGIPFGHSQVEETPAYNMHPYDGRSDDEQLS